MLLLSLMFETGAAASAAAANTCGEMKSMYKDAGCCGAASKSSMMQVVPMSNHKSGTNICDGNKPKIAYFDNVDCLKDGVAQALEQSGTNVTKGYQGEVDTSAEVGPVQTATAGTVHVLPGRQPITKHYWEVGLCPVNVHWHLGTEHLSVGEYDENGKGPATRRLAAGAVRRGFRCNKYDANNPIFTTPYKWQHCDKAMQVGETYEVHWPHSAAGACGTPNQYQTPFYDGVFCKSGIISLNPANTMEKVGVQGQIFTIVNSEDYFYPNLISGMIVDGDMGQDISKYTGSTTGPSRSNTVCSTYTPITWQVDRKCHLISASAFDKMCADMKAMRDDMSDDLHAHGARELVLSKFAADNHQRLLVDEEDQKINEYRL